MSNPLITGQFLCRADYAHIFEGECLRFDDLDYGIARCEKELADPWIPLNAFDLSFAGILPSPFAVYARVERSYRTGSAMGGVKTITYSGNKVSFAYQSNCGGCAEGTNCYSDRKYSGSDEWEWYVSTDEPARVVYSRRCVEENGCEGEELGEAKYGCFASKPEDGIVRDYKYFQGVPDKAEGAYQEAGWSDWDDFGKLSFTTRNSASYSESDTLGGITHVSSAARDAARYRVKFGVTGLCAGISYRLRVPVVRIEPGGNGGLTLSDASPVDVVVTPTAADTANGYVETDWVLFESPAEPMRGPNDPRSYVRYGLKNIGRFSMDQVCDGAQSIDEVIADYLGCSLDPWDCNDYDFFAAQSALFDTILTSVTRT